VNNSVTSRVRRNYPVHNIYGGSKVIAREFPHMVSCRSHLTYFISSNGLFFVFVHPFFPSAIFSTFLSLFLSFFLPSFLPSFPVLLLLLPTDAVVQRVAQITYF